MRLDEVTRCFFDFESEHALDRWRPRGVPVWERVRLHAHQAILNGLGVLGEPHEPASRELRHRVGHAASHLRNAIVANPFLSSSVDVLVVGHPRRKQTRDGRWEDIYCDPILDSLGHSQMYVESPHLGRHLEPAVTPRIRYLDVIHLWSSIRGRAAGGLSRDERAEAGRIGRLVKSAFGTDLDIPHMVNASLRQHSATYGLFIRLLRRLRPRLVLLVCSYGKETLIEACKAEGVIVAELQHGNISPHHVGYSFPTYQKETFPDYLLTFGEYWNSAAPYSVASERRLAVGFAYYERQAEPWRGAPRDDKILFISQGTIGSALSRIAVDFAHESGRRVVYKLHPGEYQRWRREYPWLASAGVEVVTGDQPGLYELMATSAAQVGVYSTGLYEGLGLGTPTYLASLPGVEVMDGLVRSGRATLIEDAEVLCSKLSGASADPDAGDEFFRPNARSNVATAVGNILDRA